MFECYQKKVGTYTFALLKSKLKNIVFGFFPLKIYCHLFHCFHRFNAVNKCNYCTTFYVNHINLSHFLDNKFCFDRDFFHKDFMPTVYVKKGHLNFHCNGITCKIMIHREGQKTLAYSLMSPMTLLFSSMNFIWQFLLGFSLTPSTKRFYLY